MVCLRSEMDASNMQIGAKRAAIRKVPLRSLFPPFPPETNLIFHLFLLQLDHELGIPIGSLGVEDFQLITRIHYIAGKSSRQNLLL